MSFHVRFIAATAAVALATVAADSHLPDSVKTILTDGINAVPGTGPIEVVAVGHFASPGVDPLYRYSQHTNISELKVQAVNFIPEPAPKEDPAPIPQIVQSAEAKTDAQAEA